MLVHTRCYNKHSITEYLINSISIYQLFFLSRWFEQARTTHCAVTTPARVQYTVIFLWL